MDVVFISSSEDGMDHTFTIVGSPPDWAFCLPKEIRGYATNLSDFLSLFMDAWFP